MSTAQSSGKDWSCLGCGQEWTTAGMSPSHSGCGPVMERVTYANTAINLYKCVDCKDTGQLSAPGGGNTPCPSCQADWYCLECKTLWIGRDYPSHHDSECAKSLMVIVTGNRPDHKNVNKTFYGRNPLTSQGGTVSVDGKIIGKFSEISFTEPKAPDPCPQHYTGDPELPCRCTRLSKTEEYVPIEPTPDMMPIKVPPGQSVADCEECRGRGGRYDDDVIGQWYCCEKCNGSGKEPEDEPLEFAPLEGNSNFDSVLRAFSLPEEEMDKFIAYSQGYDKDLEPHSTPQGTRYIAGMDNSKTMSRIEDTERYQHACTAYVRAVDEAVDPCPTAPRKEL